MITDRSIVEIVELGRSERSSGAGFMSQDEYIVSVLEGDNQLVKKLGLKHPQMAKPLFHIWNMTFLRGKYSHQTEQQITDMFKKLSYIHMGEMAPYYIMRYGFYEGHTDYRADPIAMAWIFEFKSLEEIDAAFKGKLFEALTQHFARKQSSGHSGK